MSDDPCDCTLPTKLTWTFHDVPAMLSEVIMTLPSGRRIRVSGNMRPQDDFLMIANAVALDVMGSPQGVEQRKDVVYYEDYPEKGSLAECILNYRKELIERGVLV